MKEENAFSKSLNQKNLKEEIKLLQNKMKELKSSSQHSPTLIKKNLESLGYESNSSLKNVLDHKPANDQETRSNNRSNNSSIEPKEDNYDKYNELRSNENKLINIEQNKNEDNKNDKISNQNKISNNFHKEKGFISPNKKDVINQSKNNDQKEIEKKSEKRNNNNNNYGTLGKHNYNNSFILFKGKLNENMVSKNLIVCTVNSLSLPKLETDLKDTDKLNSPDFLNIIKNEGNSSINMFSGSNLNIVTEFDHFNSNPELTEKINFLKNENVELRKNLDMLKRKLEYLKQARELQLTEKSNYEKEESKRKIHINEESRLELLEMLNSLQNKFKQIGQFKKKAHSTKRMDKKAELNINKINNINKIDNRNNISTKRMSDFEKYISKYRPKSTVNHNYEKRHNRINKRQKTLKRNLLNKSKTSSLNLNKTPKKESIFSEMEEIFQKVNKLSELCNQSKKLNDFKNKILNK